MGLDHAFRMCVLVVDDDDHTRLTVGDLLNMAGFDVAFAEDGIQALDQCQQSGPDAVLMDVNMPRMDGIQATRELRRMQHGGKLKLFPIIGATGMPTTKEACLGAGMNACLSKPLDFKLLRDEIEQLMRCYALVL